MKRVFFAISLSQTVINELLKKREYLYLNLNKNVNWVDPQLMHITIKFIAAVETHSLIQLFNPLTSFIKEINFFFLSVEKIATFPSPCSKIIAVYLNPHPQLLKIHSLINELGEKVGIAAEDQPYLPHITLGRFQYRSMPINSIFCKDCFIPVKELVLYESKPALAGSSYIPLQYFKLLE